MWGNLQFGCVYFLCDSRSTVEKVLGAGILFSDVRGRPAVVVDLSTKGETSSTLFKHPTAFDTTDED